MDSFMSWIGGKKALRKKIVEQFPEPRTYNRYIEDVYKRQDTGGEVNRGFHSGEHPFSVLLKA